jgi:hypothetical protein
MRVAREFRQHGWDVTQSDYYQDPETDQWREVDLIACLQFSQSERQMLRLAVVASCKCASDPWVALTHRQGFGINPLFLRPVSWVGEALFKTAANDPQVSNCRLNTMPTQLGYGLSQTTERRDPKQRDPAYEACWFAVKGAVGTLSCSNPLLTATTDLPSSPIPWWWSTGS